jgi:hypothetical protein
MRGTLLLAVALVSCGGSKSGGSAAVGSVDGGAARAIDAGAGPADAAPIDPAPDSGPPPPPALPAGFPFEPPAGTVRSVSRAVPPGYAVEGDLVLLQSTDTPKALADYWVAELERRKLRGVSAQREPANMEIWIVRGETKTHRAFVFVQEWGEATLVKVYWFPQP